MRAIRFHGKGDIRFEDMPEPPPPVEGQVRLRVRMAGICGSDLHNYATGQWMSRLQLTPGHECVPRCCPSTPAAGSSPRPASHAGRAPGGSESGAAAVVAPAQPGAA